ncbi:MAG: GNAT family N-acetyltransferase [Flavobacteriaceae bacterium]|nr:GNAT family N-acetyltransferase [Flavobacteriaceae bacterium]
MITLKGHKLYLRALEPEDLEFLFDVENTESFWEISNTQAPFSRHILEQYLLNSYKDIYEAKQLRLVISDYDDKPLGLIDLFDFDPKNKRAGIGILIHEAESRSKGFGREALGLLVKYCFHQLDLRQLYCHISEDNKSSLKLFKSEGFEVVGLMKDWNFYNGTYKNVYFLQHINS